MAGGSIRVICGPTAAGKSALALALAERFGASIISADSRQVYRCFDIGTAKPDARERARVPHYGVDVVEPVARYSAAAWAADAERWIADVAERGRAPVIVGGTGFYVRALTAPLFDEPDLDPLRRRVLAGVLDGMPTSELRRWCEQLDPARATLGRVQLLRAIEVTLLTGIALSSWHRSAVRASRLSARYLVIDPGVSLQRRIVERVDAMLRLGWEAEVERLARTVPEDAPAWNATGYGVVRDLVRGRIEGREAVERIVIDTRQYAKRQRTWFRHQLPAVAVTMLDPTAPDALRRAEAWWTSGDDA